VVRNVQLNNSKRDRESRHYNCAFMGWSVTYKNQWIAQ
jgi:hypothetical protein